ncbi:MAG: hypothetical protein HKP27_03290, partial [Myxococcales bacterium]|nr:hypothetical protein [Myxococcales bacterium]
MMEKLDRAPVLLVATCRTGFEPSSPWIEPAERVQLSRLPRSQAKALIRGAAQEQPLSDAWVEAVLSRADGIPLFVEELVHSAIDSGRASRACPSDGVGVPETLQDLLEARLDSLGAAKELVQLAAVLGREFSHELILKVSGMQEEELAESLERAIGAELFYRRGSPPSATYLFKHALLRDAAYRSLLRATRRRHHLHVAQTIIARLPEVAESRPEVVAHHLSEAEEHELAAHYWRCSGERHSARSAHREAIADLRRGLDAVAQLEDRVRRDELELPLQIALGVSLQAAKGFSSPAVRGVYDRAGQLCETVRDPSLRASGLWGSVAFCVTSGDLEKARSLAERLATIAGTDATPRTAAAYALGNVAYLEGRFAEARAHSENALRLYRSSESAIQVARWGHDFESATHAYLGWILWPLGRWREAQSYASRGIARARAVGDPATLAFALVFAAAAAKMLRDRKRTKRLADEAALLSDTYGFPLWLGSSTILQGWCESDPSVAVAQTRRGVALAAATQNQTAVPHILGILADVLRAARLQDDALATVELALATAARLGMHFWDAELLGQRAELYLELGRREEAVQTLEESLAVATSQNAPGLALRCHLRRLRHTGLGFDRAHERSALATCLDKVQGDDRSLDLSEARAAIQTSPRLDVPRAMGPTGDAAPDGQRMSRAIAVSRQRVSAKTTDVSI